jgi:hypothetical protein
VISKPALFLDCRMMNMPTDVSPDRRLHLLYFHPLNLENAPIEGFSELFGPLKPRSEIIPDTYRCELRNFATDPVFNVMLTFDSTFRAVVRDSATQAVRGSGKIANSFQNGLRIPGVLSSEPFVFWLSNGSELYVHTRFREEARLQRIGESLPRAATLQQTGQPVFSMGPLEER